MKNKIWLLAIVALTASACRTPLQVAQVQPQKNTSITSEIAENEEEIFVEETDAEDADVPLMETQKISTTTEVEEINVVTKLSMPSRKLKVKISNELLLELEKRQINFKLN